MTKLVKDTIYDYVVVERVIEIQLPPVTTGPSGSGSGSSGGGPHPSFGGGSSGGSSGSGYNGYESSYTYSNWTTDAPRPTGWTVVSHF